MADRMINAKRPTLAIKMLRTYALGDRTDDEAAAAAGLLNSCYWKRSSELRYLGFIEPTGQIRTGRAGVGRIVCQITHEGTRVLVERSRRLQ